jgi:DHA2 family multidrug resistance protein
MRAGFTSEMDFFDIALPPFIQGAALACFFVPLSAIIISGLSPAQMAAATGLSNFARITAGAFGASISITLWEERAALHHAQLAETITPYHPAAQNALDALQRQGIGQEQALALINRSIDVQAATLSVTEFFWVSGVIFLLLLGLIGFARSGHRG